MQTGVRVGWRQWRCLERGFKEAHLGRQHKYVFALVKGKSRRGVCQGENSILKGVAGTWSSSSLGSEGVCGRVLLALQWDTGNSSLVEGSFQVCWGTRPELED